MWKEVIDFWFVESDPQNWFQQSDAFDEKIRQRFSRLHAQAAACELDKWRQHPEGRLAEILLLDQFSRNLFRGSAKSYAWDALALALSQEALRQEADKALEAKQKAFLYMPFMHSESLIIQKQSLQLYSQKGLEENLPFAESHYKIIEEFGRYPHRNEELERTSTAAELSFLKKHGRGF
tara:strand:- start:8185 stop:8721 length:537 start_codon:yes stop_codon:yes gene_type:complete